MKATTGSINLKKVRRIQKIKLIVTCLVMLETNEAIEKEKQARIQSEK